jgi:hypothetical protein
VTERSRELQWRHVLALIPHHEVHVLRHDAGPLGRGLPRSTARLGAFPP